jgi:hypothetical protein
MGELTLPPAAERVISDEFHVIQSCQDYATWWYTGAALWQCLAGWRAYAVRRSGCR